MSKKCIGVEIAGSEIRIVELRRAGERCEVLQAARIMVGGGEPSAVAAALEGFFVQTETRAAGIVCSIPASVCSIKFADVPPASPADLARIARFEAESQIPLPLSEVVWSFDAERGNGGSTCHLVIAAARMSAVEELVAALESVGIRLMAVIPSILAGVAGSAQAGGLDEPVLVVDVGAEWSDLCAAQGGHVYGARSLKLGTDDLRTALVQDREADAAEAEELMQSAFLERGPVPVGEERSNAVDAWIEKLAGEIGRSVVALGGAGPSRRPRRVVLVGETATVPGMAEALGRWSGMPVTVADPWSGAHLSDVCARTIRDAPAVFTTATGLARAALERTACPNLIPRHLAHERRRRQRDVSIIGALGAAAAALLVAFVAGASGIADKSSEVRAMRAQVRQIQREIRRAGPSLRAEAAAVREAATGLGQEDSSCLELLRRLSVNLPQSIWLSDLSFEAGKSVVLKGGALSHAAVADAVDALTSLEMFQAVTLDYSKLARGGGQNYDFQITCSLSSSKSEPRKAGGQSGAAVQTGIVVQ